MARAAQFVATMIVITIITNIREVQISDLELLFASGIITWAFDKFYR